LKFIVHFNTQFASLGGMLRDFKALVFDTHDHDTGREGHSTPDVIIDIIWLVLHLGSLGLSVFLIIGAQKVSFVDGIYLILKNIPDINFSLKII